MNKIDLTREQQVTLHLAARSISVDPSSLVLSETAMEALNWGKIFEISNTQAITLATFDAVMPYKKYIPDDIYARWKNTAMSILQSDFDVIQSQVDLIEILDKHGFSYIILKGMAAGAYYPNPELRALGDVDFLIDPSTQEQVEQALLKNGYQKSHGDHPNHVVFRKPKAHLEMHFEVAGVPYGWQGDAVRVFLKNAVFEPQKRVHDMGDFHVPSDLCHGLILLLHMQHHMLGEGLGLRHLCDWAVYVNQTHDKGYWTEILIPFLKKIGLFTYAAVMTKTCATYLQSVCPDWARDADDETCAEVLEDILACGNFGQNDEQRSKGGMLVSEHGKDGTKRSRTYYLFKILHGETCKTKGVKKCCLLYPFVFIWKVLWHLGRTLTGKSKPLRVFTEAEKRKTVYEKLEVFEVENEEK